MPGELAALLHLTLVAQDPCAVMIGGKKGVEVDLPLLNRG